MEVRWSYTGFVIIKALLETLHRGMGMNYHENFSRKLFWNPTGVLDSNQTLASCCRKAILPWNLLFCQNGNYMYDWSNFIIWSISSRLADFHEPRCKRVGYHCWRDSFLLHLYRNNNHWKWNPQNPKESCGRWIPGLIANWYIPKGKWAQLSWTPKSRSFGN